MTSRRCEYTAAVKPGEKAELLYEIVQRQGHNAKQNNVTIERRGSKRSGVRLFITALTAAERLYSEFMKLASS